MYPTAMAKWNAWRCGDMKIMGERDGEVAIVATEAGIDPMLAKRMLAAEEDRCCQISGRWEPKACNTADLEKRVTSARRMISVIREFVGQRDAAR